jgi:hypothetical protein
LEGNSSGSNCSSGCTEEIQRSARLRTGQQQYLLKKFRFLQVSQGLDVSVSANCLPALTEQCAEVHGAHQQTAAPQRGHIFLLDASYYVARYHHAFDPASRLSGGDEDEDAVIQHMFLNTMLGMIHAAQQFQAGSISGAYKCESPFGHPTHIIAVFDGARSEGAVSIRREICPDYKVLP